MPAGRPLIFENPEELWSAFEDYKDWAHENPWLKSDFIRSGECAGQKVYLETERPLTEVEFATFCKMSRTGLQEYAKRDEFSGIYSRIKDEMMAQRLSGGMTGAFNANLVARLDGLADKTDQNHSGNVGLNINVSFDESDEDSPLDEDTI